MNTEFFRIMFDHAYWARDRILNAADGLSQDDYTRPNGFNYGSLRGILVHQLAAEVGWLGRWQGITLERLTDAEAPTLESLHEHWAVQEKKLRAYLDQLTDERLLESYNYTRQGKDYSHPLWQMVMQIVIHGTQHRSEAAEALTMIGRSPGDLDFAEYVRSKSQPA
jgi:uncharacterized damage-inducible protein DinB